MPFFSDDLIEEVRSRNDIVDVISSYVRLQKKGATHFGLCPFHNEKTPSFSVSREKQMFYCFGCGAGGNVFTFLMKYDNCSFPEAMETLAERAGVTLPKREMSDEQKRLAGRREQLLAIQKEAAVYFYRMLKSETGARALSYFHDRGLSDETIRHFGLGFSLMYGNDLYQYLKKKGYSDDLLKDSGLVSFYESKGGRDKFWNRAMFPIMNVAGKVIGFGGRVMGEGEPKYLNSPETPVFDKSRNLYALNFARTSRRRGILLCEGYMDVIALHQAGFDNAVASLGTSFTSGHASLLGRYTKEVFLTFDSDGAGRRAALRAIPILKEAGLIAKVLNLSPYKDPDELIRGAGAEEFEKRIEEAENSFLFTVRMLEADYDLSDPESKTQFFRAVAERILGFPEELERENYIEAIAVKYGISFENLRALVRTEGARGGIVSRRSNLRSTQKKEKPEDGMRRTQKLLLTWLVEDASLYPKIRSVIHPEDFTDEVLHRIAEELFSQLEAGEINPARIVSMFEEEEKQQEAASVFHARVDSIDTQKERDQALRDTVLKIRQNSIDTRLRNRDATDLLGLQKLMEEKKQFEELKNKKTLF